MKKDLPLGFIASFFGNADSTRAPATGTWEPCDGRTLQIADYPELFAVIGLTYGGDESKGEFKVPDYRGRFLRGTNYAAGGTAAHIGRAEGYATRLPHKGFSLSLSQLPADEERIAATAVGHTLAKRNSGSVTQPVSGGDAESRPANVYCNHYIKSRPLA